MEQVKKDRIFNLKTLVFGMLGAFLIGAGSPYCNMIYNPWGLSADFITAGAIIVFFILVGIINVLLKIVNQRLALNAGQLIIVYIMMIVASAIPSWGLVQAFISILVGLYYFATPENRWAELIHPHVKGWMVPHGDLATAGFFEGLHKGESIPWGAWLVPLIAWCSFFIVLYFVMICMAVILRKQWVEKERLLFPLTRLPMEMAKENEGKSVFPPFFKNRLMWIGFAIPFLFTSWNALHAYFHFIPEMPWIWHLSIFRRTVPLNLTFSFPVIGFSYLLSADVSLSIWLFHLLHAVERGIFETIGFSIEKGVPYTYSDTMQCISWQGMGSLIAMVIFGLWMARSHLKDVFQKAFSKRCEVDDSNEMLSYRTAVLGMIGGLVFLSVWLWLSGLPPLVIPVVLFAAFIIFIGLTKIIAQGGIGFARAQCIPQPFAAYGMGTNILGPIGMTSLAFTFTWVSDVRTIVMTSVANGLKMVSDLKIRQRPLFWAIMIAIIIALGGAIWSTFTVAYNHGGLNLSRVWFLTGCGKVPWNFLTHIMRHPIHVSWSRWGFAGIGASIMGLLMLARNRFLWWPIHYIGFPIATTYPIYCTWFSVFIAWLFKVMILKYGGIRLYRQLYPMFLGFILGQLMAVALWLLIDGLTGMVDHIVPIGLS